MADSRETHRDATATHAPSAALNAPAAEEACKEASALGRAGRLEEAVARLRLAPAIAEHARSQALLGTLLSMLGRADEALEAFERSIAIDPNQPVVLSDMSNALTQLDRQPDAIAALDRALALDPGYGPALHNRAGLLAMAQQPEAALIDADAALLQYPERATAHRYRAHALWLLDRREEALVSIERSLGLDATLADAHAMRSHILNALGRFEEGLAAIQDAAGRQPPGMHEHTYARGVSRLRLRDWGGWDDYEQRWDAVSLSKRGWKPERDVLGPRIGRLLPEDFAGKHVLLVGEQGVGDEIMFAGAIPEVERLAAGVTVLTDPRLQSLFAHSFPGVRTVHDLEEARQAPCDMLVPLGSLPHAFRRRKEDFPGTPYLAPAPETVETWRERLGPRRSRLRVGVSWRGGSTTTRRSARSLELLDLAPLLNRDDCEFVSLQYGKVAPEVAKANASLQRPVRCFPREQTENFEYLAGLAQALDIVVSVQTSLIHLCGAIGAPCLVMIPFSAEWRYGATGRTMPWYNSVELFRQTAPGDWDPVIAAIGAELDRRSA